MGRHLQLLECSTDGAIADDARRHARALDDLEAAATAKRARVALRVVALKPEYVIRQMVRVIATAAPARAAVHVKDFERAGICAALAERHFAAALARARLIEPAIDALEKAC